VKLTYASAAENYINACRVVGFGGEKSENYHSFSPTAAEAASPWLSFAGRPTFYLIGLVTLSFPHFYYKLPVANVASSTASLFLF
jgi:hypothetical protein